MSTHPALTAPPARAAVSAAPALAALPVGTRYETREGWLKAAINALAPLFEAAGAPLPEAQVSVGWPGGAGRKNTVIGQCWHKSTAADAVAHIFISPVLADRARVLDVLAHELIHAWDEGKSGHKGAFVKMARTIGLAGPATATHAGDDLAAILRRVAEELGAYPHGAITPASRTTTGKGRMVKCECADCGLIIYTTRKWISAYGEFPCACGGIVHEA